MTSARRRESAGDSRSAETLHIEFKLGLVLQIKQTAARERAGEIRLSLQQLADCRCLVRALFQMPQRGNTMSKSPIMSIGNAARAQRPFVGKFEFPGENVGQ